jgi:hypothetical protein
MVCVKGDRQTCYRTSDDERVEGSQDGGETWQVIWQIPPNRRGFMEAYRLSSPGPCRTLFDPGPYDLVVLPNADGTHTLIVALGSEGVLVRRSEGNWEQVGVLRAEPTPTRFSGDNLIRLFNITYPESLYLLGAALFTFWILSLWGWSFLQSRDEILRVQLSILKRRIARMSMFILVATFLVSLIVPSALLILFLLAGLFILSAPLVIWALILRAQDNPEKAKSARIICFLTGVGLFPGSWSPFVMWAYGSIDSRDLALKVSVVLATLIAAGGVLALASLARKRDY